MPFPYPEADIFQQICGPDTAMPFPYPESDIFLGNLWAGYGNAVSLPEI